MISVKFMVILMYQTNWIRISILSRHHKAQPFLVWTWDEQTQFDNLYDPWYCPKTWLLCRCDSQPSFAQIIFVPVLYKLKWRVIFFFMKWIRTTNQSHLQHVQQCCFRNLKFNVEIALKIYTVENRWKIKTISLLFENQVLTYIF